MLVSTVFQNPKTYFFNINTTLELLFYLENIGLARDEMDIVDRVFLIDKGKLKKFYRRSEFLKLDKNELKALSLRDKELCKLEVPYLKKGEDFYVSSSFSIMGLL